VNEAGRTIEEYSFLVTVPKEQATELKEFLTEMQDKYNQSSFLWIEPDTRQVYADTYNIGTFKGGKLGEMYSRIRGRPFIFE
jgi:phage-related protein